MKPLTINPIIQAISVGTDSVRVKMPPALSRCVPGFFSSAKLATRLAALNNCQYSGRVNPPRGCELSLIFGNGGILSTIVLISANLNTSRIDCRYCVIVIDDDPRSTNEAVNSDKSS